MRCPGTRYERARGGRLVGVDMAKGTCSIDGCERRVYCRGWCYTHYDRWRTTGAVGGEIRPREAYAPSEGECAKDGCKRLAKTRGMCKTHANAVRVANRRANQICKVEGCQQGVTAADLCRMHYERKRTGRPESGRAIKPHPAPVKCAVEGCNREVRTKGWCYTHYARWWKSGDPGPAAIRAKRALPAGTECSVDGCLLKRHRGGCGMCAAHYSRLRKWGSTGSPEVGTFRYADDARCSVEGCDRRPRVRNMCRAHAERAARDSADFLAPIQVRNWEKKSCPFPGCANKAKGTDYCAGHQLQRAKGQEIRPLQRKTDPTARDEFGRKLCIGCDQWLPVDSFTRGRNRADGLNAKCKACWRNRRILKNFGITADDYDKLLANQGGRCAICAKTPKANGRSLAVDHDHACCPSQQTCGKCVRGLVCSACNLILGMIEDKPDTIVSMARYLQVTTYGRLL